MAFCSILPMVGRKVDKEDYIRAVGQEFSIDELKEKQEIISGLEDELRQVELARDFYMGKYLTAQSQLNHIRRLINED